MEVPAWKIGSNMVSRDTVPPKYKISLFSFLCYIAKCHQICKLIKQKHSIEHNESDSLEIKCRIAVILSPWLIILSFYHFLQLFFLFQVN